MKKTSPFFALLLAVLATTGTAWAAAGETCDDAISVLPGVTAGELTSGSRWYSFEADRTGSIPFNTSRFGTEFATRLAIYGDCGGAAIGSSEGVGERRAYLVVDAAFPGQRFYIEVGSMGGGGRFELAADAQTRGPQCPGVGDCFSANGSAACDDSCSGPPCPGCCAAICGADAFCCDVDWDQICADAAVAACVVIPVELQNFEVDR